VFAACVLGMLAWSMMYRFTPEFFSRQLFDRRSVLLQLLLSEVGIYTVSTVLFAAGYVGASLVREGKVGSVFVGASMEFSDIPAAVSIFMIIVSLFLGAINIMTGKLKTAEIQAKDRTLVVSGERPSNAATCLHDSYNPLPPRPARILLI